MIPSMNVRHCIPVCMYAQDGDNNIILLLVLIESGRQQRLYLLYIQHCYNFKVNVDSHRSYYSMKHI